MLSEQLLTEIGKLSRADKLRVVQILVNQLAQEEEMGLVHGAQYEVWSPFDAAGAANSFVNSLAGNKNESEG